MKPTEDVTPDLRGCSLLVPPLRHGETKTFNKMLAMPNSALISEEARYVGCSLNTFRARARTVKKP